MTFRVAFRVYGKPVAQGSMRSFPVWKGKGSKKKFGGTRTVHASKGLADWRHLIAIAAAETMDGWTLFEGPVRVSAAFYLVPPKRLPKKKRPWPWPTTIPDLDKLLRALLDGITHTILVDDSQVVAIGDVFKAYADPLQKERPGALVLVEEVEPPGPGADVLQSDLLRAFEDATA